MDASRRSADELKSWNRPIPFAEYTSARIARPIDRSAQSSAPQSASAALREECAKHTKEAASSKGWFKDRFTSCQKRPFDLVLRDIKNAKDIGRLWFDQWVIGIASDGGRSVTYTVSVEDIRVQTVQGEDARKWRVGQLFRHSINASDSDPDAKVTAPKTTRRDELLGVWDKEASWTLNYTSPDKGPLHTKGNRQIVSSTVSMDVTASTPTPNVTPYSLVDAYHSNVRYDYAGPHAGKHKGTVFTQARVELVMNRKDPAVNESAQHIYEAQKNPELTFPSWPGKSIPGATEPLHRLVDEKKQEENRSKAIATCRDVWGNYSGSGLQCDEYPFASTKEGANAKGQRYSARLIDGSDNLEGGKRIKSVYEKNRMLDGDAFYVRITF
ncbi:NucA/NucB deoxyribonuclease domain-containing protein [Streptomyces buecherae]|uniref:NucA/NucB deoxyribonuclease domain-containing protein n=1 Tax=Streptomyces buecherae TaxID=2763006 RepID=UPI0033F978B9